MAYTPIDLGVLGGSGSMTAYAINSQNQAAGVSSTASGNGHAFRWENGIITDLGTLGGPTSIAYDINDAGQIVGESDLAGVGRSLFLWQNGGMTDLGVAANSPSINNAGVILARRSGAAIWENRTVVNLADLLPANSGWTNLRGEDLNDRGQIVGTGSINGADRAFVYTDTDGDGSFLTGPGQIVSLGTLGGTYSGGQAINLVGQVTGISPTSTGERHTFLWTPTTPNGSTGTMKDLGALSVGNIYPGPSSMGLDLNQAGTVVGQSSLPGGFDYLATISTNGTKVKDLNAQIGNGTGWNLREAWGINNSGWITGFGANDDISAGFVLVPGTTTVPLISINDVTVTEGDAGTVNAVFTVTLSKTSTETVTVQYESADYGAQAGSDYVAAAGVLTFAPGQTSKTITVVVNGDTNSEFDERLFINLTNSINALCTDARGLATIADDDAKISINAVSLAEGNSSTTPFVFTVTLSKPMTQTVTADYSTRQNSAKEGSDYIATAGTLTFNPGETSKTITVQVIGDTVKEADELFYVDLSNLVNVVWSDPNGEGTILNDEKGGKPLLASSLPTVARTDRLQASQAQVLLTEAITRWHAAGAKVERLRGVDLHIADLGGTVLGMASGHTIWLDDNAAGWGWFVDQTPQSDVEFTRPGNQGEANRMDVLTVLEHELGHLLGHDHEPHGVMQETLVAGTRATVTADTYGQLPLSFEANQGQTDADVNFLSRGSGYTLFLTPDEAVLALKQGTAGGDQGSDSGDVVRMRLVDADPAARAVGIDALPGRSNYLIGNNPSEWHTDIPNYGRVEYEGVYPGIDLVYYGNQRQLEYDFVVAPGADPRSIRLGFDGVGSVSLDGAGNLILHASGGDVVEHAPVIYQQRGGVRQFVAGHYVLADDGQVTFEVGAYDRSRPLVIDPVLSYSTYLGGQGHDFSYSIAVDSAGNAYVTGYTLAKNFPTQNPLQAANGGSQDIFITKLNSAGTGLVYSTYLGGLDNDWGQGIAIDGSGNAYITGFTRSSNFPTTSNALDRTCGSDGACNGAVNDALVAKLNASGSALLYSTYLGGSDEDRGAKIAIDGAGNAYVTGLTGSSASTGGFPVSADAFQTTAPGGTDAFVTKLDTTAVGSASLVYSTYLGTTNYDRALGIALDSSNNAYVTGFTDADDFPLAGPAPLQSANGGGYDAFVTKLNSTGSGLVYSTYLGGPGSDVGNAIAVDRVTGEAYVMGSTNSANFPVANAYQSTSAGGGDAFVSRLNATGSALAYSTYLGGSGWDGGNTLNFYAGIAVDAAGNAYVSSVSQSSNFPTKNALAGQGSFHGVSDVVVAKINTSRAGAPSLIFSTYLGGADEEESFGIALDAAGNVYVTGETQSNDFPVSKGAFQRRKSGGIHVTEGFVTKIDMGGLIAATTADRGSLRPSLGNAVIVSPRGNESDSSVAGDSKGHRLVPETPAAGRIRRHHAQTATAQGTRAVDLTLAGTVARQRGSRFSELLGLKLDSEILEDLTRARHSR